jgi:hypothetical protein
VELELSSTTRPQMAVQCIALEVPHLPRLLWTIQCVLLGLPHQAAEGTDLSAKCVKEFQRGSSFRGGGCAVLKVDLNSAPHFGFLVLIRLSK